MSEFGADEVDFVRRFFEVRRDDLAATRVVEEESPVIATGQVLLRVRRFALSANNITYAILGDDLSYWDFFPANDPGWGRIPVWGFGEVVASEHDSVTVGRRVFGYLPMGTHVVLTPGRINDRGVTDNSPHRVTLPAAYNAYRWLDTDSLFDPDYENEYPLLLPVFMLSFLLDAFLADNEFFGTSTVVLSSASSRAAMGAARLLAERGIEVVGLTSARNASFVDGLGVYASTVSYDHVERLSPKPTVFADVAGNATVRGKVTEWLGENLAHTSVVGATHWDARSDGGRESGGRESGGRESGGQGADERAVPFFVPDHLNAWVARWGGAEFDRRFGGALSEFAAWHRNRLSVVHAVGAEAVTSAYLRVLTGRGDPAVGNVLSMR